VVGGQGSPKVQTGDTVTLTTVTVSSGTLIARTAIPTLNINGGTVEQIGGAIGSTTAVNLFGGVFYPRTTGTYVAVYQSAGTVDCTRDARGRASTNYYMYGGSIKDPSGTINFGANGLRVYPKLSAVSLDLPPLKKYVISAA